ncbi:hypothetical protein MW887_009144 [Aspergillus wentii]|nr:hypothetical protein MW887_009144 [Aspergillus wentii]
MPSKVVNRPTDSKQKEKDINQKLQLFGIYHGFKTGKLPSNKQCDIALNSALSSKALSSPSKELSSEGQVLVKDVRDVIEQAKKLILSKNDGQLIQEFIWEAQQITSGDAQKPNAPVGKDVAKQDGSQALEGLKTLGTLLITNGEFRKILSDAAIIARDMAGDASQTAANKLRPSEEQLSQVDQPAEENLWHEKPNISKDQLKSRFKRNKEEADEAAESTVQAATGGKQPETTSDIDVRAGAAQGAQKLKEKVPEDTKNRTRELTDKTKSYLSEKMPQERRDQAIWRLKKMVIEIQGHADYQQAIETLLNLAEKYAGHSKDLTQQGTGAVQGVRANSSVQTVETNLRILIERFANSTSLDDFFGSLDNIYRDADKDPELRGWFKNVNTLIRKSLRESGYIMEEDCNREWNQLYDHGRYLLRDRYKNHTDRILDEIKFVGDQFNRDPQNKAFANSMEKLFNDLGRDSDGNVKFKKHLLKDIGNVILPGIFENVRYVPVPRIEVSDPMADVVVENLVIESDNLMPNVVELGSDNYFRWGRKKISSKRDNKIMISASGIQADLRDVSYYIKKKEGFPAITDKGVMDIFLGGEGFGFKVAASTAQKGDRQHFIKLDKVTVNIKNMDIKLKKSKHKVLFSVFKPMLFRVVRPILQNVIEKQIRDAFASGDEFAYEIQSDVKRAQEAVEKDPENTPNIYTRYMDAIRAKMTEKKQKAEAAPKRDTKVQTAATLHDSLFPDIKLPGGISSKATEYVELANKGDRWESAIFSIGSASESTDIPKPSSVTRKPHQTADGRVTDGSAAAAAAPAGATNGHPKSADQNGYPSRGFSDEVNQAFGNGHANGAANGSKVTTHGLSVPGAQTAFNPQAA